MTLLAEAGADVNARETTSGKTALFYVIPSGNAATVKMLLEKGARTDIADNNGDTPLLLAKRMNLPAIIELLDKPAEKKM